MSTLSSRMKVRTDRNALFESEQKVVDRYRAMVARELEQWCSGSDLMSIKLTPKHELIRLHSSLGTAVRNEYELWMPEHEVTEIWYRCEKEFRLATGESDGHPCHPDNFSFSCIERLWENLQ